MADTQDNQDNSAQAARRLDTLLRTGRRRTRVNKAYTSFVRTMRLVLPLAAVGIVGLLVSWPRVEERMAKPPVAATPADSLPQTVGQNELINPRFESEDDKSQPYTLTAARAVQSSDNPDIVFLDKPMGDINLSDGAWIAAEATEGQYNQKEEQLSLRGRVKLFHDSGYELVSEKLQVDLKNRKASSDAAVHGQGPAGTLEATGLQAEMNEGTLVFTGPAKLVLNKALKGL
jgi:lipopolysaccharide export system protein LptC